MQYKCEYREADYLEVESGVQYGLDSLRVASFTDDMLHTIILSIKSVEKLRDDITTFLDEHKPKPVSAGKGWAF